MRTSLLANACVTMLLTTHTSVPHLLIQANGGAVDTTTVELILKHTEDVFHKHSAFTTRWDLRQAPVPPWSVVTKCVQWALRHRRQLCKNRRLVILVPPGRLTTIISFVLHSVGPSCPRYVGANATEADAFERLPTRRGDEFS